MARGAVRGALSGALGLLVLQAVSTSRGSRAVGGGFDLVADLVERALSPEVAAIPDRAHATGRQEDPPPAPAAPAPTGPKQEGTKGTTGGKFDRIPGVND